MLQRCPKSPCPGCSAANAFVTRAGLAETGSNRSNWDGLRPGAVLIKEIGPPPDGPQTWIPGYNIYYLGTKIVEGRDVTGMDVVFAAVDVDNTNLAVAENLVSIAERVGLSPVDARMVLEQRQYRAAVDADWRRSRELGITGVPTFIIEGRGLVGAQPYEQLAALVTEADAQPRDT